MQRTERNIRSLMNVTADTARLLLNGQEQVVLAQLQIGAQVGQAWRTDSHGWVDYEGYSTLNQASITGESMPVEKTVGNEVLLAQSMAMEP